MDYDGNILGLLLRLRKKKKKSMTVGFTSVRKAEDLVLFPLSSSLLWITDGLCDLPVQSHG